MLSHFPAIFASRLGKEAALLGKANHVMLFWLIRPLRYLADLIRNTGSSRSIAWGAALGMLAGLSPKDTLVAWVLAILPFLFNVNLPAALVSGLFFTWAGVFTDPLADRIGQRLLTHSELLPYWTWLYELPAGPWAQLNNTIVLGNVIVGLLLFYPVYHVSERIARWLLANIAEPLAERLQRYRIFYVLFGADITSGWRLRG